MKKSFITLTITFLVACSAFAQSVTISPSNAAIIEANGTNKGILIPRVTTAQRNAITPPAAVTGLMVYDTDLKDLYIYNGLWQRATIGELPIELFGSIANQGIVATQNNANFGRGLQGIAPTGTGVLGMTDSGTGVTGVATTTGVAGSFSAQTVIAVSASNNSNAQATGRFINNTVGGKALDITGTIVQTTDKNGDGILATNTNANGVAIKAIGTQNGVYASSNNGTAVLAYSPSGRGIEGNSISGNGVAGFSDTGKAGIFQNNSSTNQTVNILNQNADGMGVNAQNTSATQPTARFQNNTVGGKALDVTGTLSLTSAVSLAPAAFFSNTHTNGIGMKGEGNHIGVNGISTNGSGSGVHGYSTSGVGTSGASFSNFGVRGDSETGSAGFFLNNTNTNPTVKIENATSGGTAIEINGAIRVSGTNPAAFVITATAGNTTNGTLTSGGALTIPNTTLANSATDILIVTHAFGTYLNIPFGVFWSGTNWNIYLEQLNTNVPIGTKFNVLVIKQ